MYGDRKYKETEKQRLKKYKVKIYGRKIERLRLKIIIKQDKKNVEIEEMKTSSS